MSSDIPPFLTYVRSEYLYELKEGFGYFIPATVFAISSTINESLKFYVMVDDKTIFGNIPVCALANNKTAPRFSEMDCVFEECPDNIVLVNQFEYLTNVSVCGVWHKRDETFWQKGTYVLTCEWQQTKKQLHLIELDDGNYILWPNEKLTWGDNVPEKLPKYETEG